MNFLFYTDPHERSDVPAKRKEKTSDEFIENELNNLEQMYKYADEHNIKTIINGGDLFNGWQTTNTTKLLIKIIKLHQKYDALIEWICVGNHDLPNHRIDMIDKSNLGILQASGNINVVDELNFDDIHFDMFHYTQELIDRGANDKFNIAVIHDYIFEKVIPPHFKHAYTVNELVKMMPSYYLYLCGHNQEKFIVDINGKTVINGGSFGRTKRTQGKHRTTFWDCNTETQEYLPIEVDEDLDLLDTTKDENKMDIFVEETKEFKGETFDFRKYVEDALVSEKIEDNVKQIVYKCIGE